MEAKLVRDDAPPDEFMKPAHVISSLHCYHLDMQSHVPHTESEMCQVIPSSWNTQGVEFNGFTVGSILILRYMCMCMPVYAYVWMCLIEVIEKNISIGVVINPHWTARTPVHPVINTTGSIATGYYRCETHPNMAATSSLATQPVAQLWPQSWLPKSLATWLVALPYDWQLFNWLLLHGWSSSNNIV